MNSSTGPGSDAQPQKGGIYEKAFIGVKRTKSLLKDSPLTVLGLTLKYIPKVDEIIEQSKILCEDYLYSRLSGLVTDRDRRNSLSETMSEVSKEIQIIGGRLESTYPTLYKNVSGHVNMPLKSDVAVRRVLVSIGDTMFKNGVITWGRIIAMFAISAAIATECVKNEHPELIFTVMNLFSEVVEKHAATWIRKQGGWVDIMKAFRVMNKETRTLWALTGIGASVGFVITWLTTQGIGMS